MISSASDFGDFMDELASLGLQAYNRMIYY